MLRSRGVKRWYPTLSELMRPALLLVLPLVLGVLTVSTNAAYGQTRTGARSEDAGLIVADPPTSADDEGADDGSEETGTNNEAPDSDADLSWLHGTWVVSPRATLDLLPQERRLMYSAMLASLSASVSVGDGTYSGQASFLSEVYADSGSWSGTATGDGSATISAQALGQTHTLSVSTCGDGCLVVAGNGERAVLMRVGE